MRKALAPIVAAAALVLAPASPAHAWWSPCDWGGCYGPGPGYYPGYYPGYWGGSYRGCNVPFNDCPPPAGRICGPCP